MDQELIAYLDQRFSALDQKVEILREETQQRFERLEDRVHQTQITVENMRGDIRLIAEAWIGSSEIQEEMRKEIKREFDEVRSTVRLPFMDLDSRVKILEARARNEGRDPVEILREIKAKYGTFS